MDLELSSRRSSVSSLERRRSVGLRLGSRARKSMFELEIVRHSVRIVIVAVWPPPPTVTAKLKATAERNLANNIVL